MYYVGIDIAKFKHDCFICTHDGEIICTDLTFQNNLEGFNQLLTVLNSLTHSDCIRIGFESTGHYALNLKLFLEKAHYSFMEYKPCTIGFYHMYSLKSLTRLRDSLVRQRSFYLVKIANVLDHTFPEFKPFFLKKIGKTALLLLTKYGSAAKISSINSKSYDILRRTSRGHFSMTQFFALKTLAKDTVGASNSIYELELSSLLNLYQNLCHEIDLLDKEITSLITAMDRPTLSIPGIGPSSTAIILSEFGDISRFRSPGSMLSFAGLEPAYYQSGTSEYTGHMVKRGSSHLRYALMTVCIPLIKYNIVFAAYYHKKRQEGKPHRIALSHVAKN